MIVEMGYDDLATNCSATRDGGRLAFAISLLLLSVGEARSEGMLAIAGTHVVPHQQSAELRYREPADPELGARVEIFVGNVGDAPLKLEPGFEPLFDGRTAAELIERGDWAWHDTRPSRGGRNCGLPPGAITVLSFNSRRSNWGADTEHRIDLGAKGGQHDLMLAKPSAWISALTFLGAEGEIQPTRQIAHNTNPETDP